MREEVEYETEVWYDGRIRLASAIIEIDGDDRGEDIVGCMVYHLDYGTPWQVNRKDLSQESLQDLEAQVEENFMWEN